MGLLICGKVFARELAFSLNAQAENIPLLILVLRTTCREVCPCINATYQTCDSAICHRGSEEVLYTSTYYLVPEEGEG